MSQPGGLVDCARVADRSRRLSDPRWSRRAPSTRRATPRRGPGRARRPTSS